jgi:acetyltransferase
VSAASAPAPEIAPILRRATSAGDGRSVLNEADSKELLRAYGIATARELVAGNVEDAGHAARELGYPVVLKVMAAEVTHKSDIGGVILGITDDDELRGAWSRLARNYENAVGEPLDQVLVAEQISGGLELVLGVHRDPEIGPVVMFGTGGVLLELHKDGMAPCRCPWRPRRCSTHHRGRAAEGLSRHAACR